MNFSKLIFTAGLLYWQWFCYFVIRSNLINFSPAEGSVYKWQEHHAALSLSLGLLCNGVMPIYS